MAVHEMLMGASSDLRLGSNLSNLARAHYESVSFIDTARNTLRDAVADLGLDPGTLPFDVAAFGSYARLEARGESDFDYLVLTHELYEDPRVSRQLLKCADELRNLPQEMAARKDRILFRDEVPAKPVSAPGSSGLFGRVVSAPEFVERIGLEQDTNQSHTIRILLLEESVSLFREDLMANLKEVIIKRYIVEDGPVKESPPRFLINDVVRYWSTLTVDYAAKRYEQISPQWGLRYLKLRISRKLAYAGTLVSLLSCREGMPADVAYLTEQLGMPPLARLAQLYKYIDKTEEKEALARVLMVADSFNGRLATKDWRDAVKSVSSKSTTNPQFDEGLQWCTEVQDALELLFFRTEFLKSASIRYLSF